MAQHPIVHVEIPTNDPKVSNKFYSDVFNWKFQVAEEFNYHMFEAAGGPGGGLISTADGPMGPGAKVSEVLVYIGTDDIEASLAQIEAHGGTVVLPKTEIPGNGWFGIFLDPTGNKIALYTAINQ